MQKLTRNEKIKITERAKTILIVLLACSCLASGYYVFDMYRDLDAVRSFWQSSDPVTAFDGGQATPASQNALRSFLELSEPELILVNKGDARGEIPTDDDAFSEISELVNTAVKEAYSRPESEIVVTDMDEWKASVATDSMYVRYAGVRSTSFEGEFYKAPQNALASVVDVYNEVSIVPNAKNGQLTLYLPDKDYKNIVKMKFTTAVAEKLDSVIKNRPGISSKSYVFAFEIGLDTRPENDGKLAPMLAIPTTEKSIRNIVAEVPRVYKTGLNFIKTTDFTMGLIEIFGYNQNTVRQYVNSEDVLIFVGETGTLSVYPEGYIEYRALGTNEGVALESQSGAGVYGATAGLINMIDRINAVSGVLPELNDGKLRIAALPVMDGQTSAIRVEFDYYVDDCRVNFLNSPAITAIINDGVLTELKMQIKTVKKTENDTHMTALLDEIDEFVGKNPQTKLIDYAKTTYKFSQSGDELSVEWDIRKGN
ncbi:MAG: hypothetical protein E7401_01195 [Ruminococcaceae bacterium]|nr:hypothetical protein [Oscillospiraceae bacterium]